MGNEDGGEIGDGCERKKSGGGTRFWCGALLLLSRYTSSSVTRMDPSPHGGGGTARQSRLTDPRRAESSLMQRPGSSWNNVHH